MPKTFAVFRPSRIEVSDDNSNFWQVPAVESISISGGEGSQTQIKAIDGLAAIAESPGVPTLAVVLASYVPHVKSLEIVKAARDNRSTIYYRVSTATATTLQAEAAATGTSAAAIATSGVVTFSGTATPDFTSDALNMLGLLIKINSDSTKYVVSNITDAGVVTVTPSPSTAVAAALYAIEFPQLRDTGAATVSAFGNYDGDPDNPISGGFTLVPSTRTDLSLV